MITWIFCLIAGLLLSGYSFLRYRFLWLRGRIPVIVYYVFQVVLLGTLFVCFFFPYLLPNDIALIAVQIVSICYLTIMIVTPVFCFLRGGIRMLGKRLHWKNRFYRFFNHPVKVNVIIFFLTFVMGIGIFVQSKIPREREVVMEVDKKASVQSLSIAAVSDLEVGGNMTKYDVKTVFSEIEKRKPDIIILLGDICHGKLSPDLKNCLNQEIKRLVSKFSVYYVEGKEDSKRDENYFREWKKQGVQTLRDNTMHLSSGIQLVGCRSHKNPQRRNLAFTFSTLDKKKPTIVFSHEDFDEQEKTTVDYDVLLHADGYEKIWFVPRQIRMLQIQFRSHAQGEST